MPDAGPTLEQIRDEIGREIVRVQEDSYGAGVSDVVVELGQDLVVVALDVELASSERTLVGAGMGDTVRISREAFQEAIAPTFIAIVERATGRAVESFASRMVMDPPWSFEVFRLGPVAS